MSSQQVQDFQPEFCDSHPSDKLESFCDACEVPTSHKCAVVEHAIRGHRMMSRESASETYMPEMKALSEKIAQKVSNLKLRKNIVNDVRKDLDVNRSIADAKIKILCQHLIDAIGNQKMQLHCEVDDVYNQKCKQIDAEVELLENEIAKAESIHSHLNHLLTVGDRGAMNIIMAQTQMKDEQEHYDDLTNVLCGDVDSDLGFTENPDCLNMNLGVVKGKKKPEKQVKLQNSNKEGSSHHDIDAATTYYESGTSSAGHSPRGREKAFADGGITEHTRVVEEPAKDGQGKDKVQTEPTGGEMDDEVHTREDDGDFDDEKEDLDKSEESAEDRVIKPDGGIANDNKVTIEQLEPMEIDKINEPKEIVITREPRDATVEQEDASRRRGCNFINLMHEVDEGSENGNGEKPLVVSDKKDCVLDVPDQNVSTETAVETERETHTIEKDGSKITDDSNPEKQNNVESKARDEHAFEEKENNDAEKLRKVGEDHDDTEDTSPGRDMDKIGEIQGKDDSMMPSDRQRQKRNNVEGEIEGIATENSSAHTREECLQLTNAQNGEDQGTSRSRPEDEFRSIGGKVDIDAESEQVDEGTDVRSKADDREEQGDKTDKKHKSEQPYGNDTEKFKYSSTATDATRGVRSENDETYHRNKSYNENIDPFGQQYSDNRHCCHDGTSITATAPNIQHGDVYTQDQESDTSPTAGTDSYDSTKDASSSGTNVWKRLWREAKGKVNLLFYKNELKSEPQGDYIDNIHKHWWGDYEKLEKHHGYIQWIFPVSEKGMNYDAQELQLDEAKKIKSDKKALARVLKSYKMMLGFYGMKLVDKEKGTIQRAANWRERYSHLNRSQHNYLRITRMLKSLGELGYEHLKTPFVEFILTEAVENGELRNCINSCVQYWLHTIETSEDRQRLTKYFDSHYE